MVQAGVIWTGLHWVSVYDSGVVMAARRLAGMVHVRLAGSVGSGMWELLQVSGLVVLLHVGLGLVGW